MGSRLQLTLIFVSWFMATGSQWDVLQIFAWGRMMADNVEKMSVVEAVEVAFDADKPCDLCKTVQKGRHTQNGSAVPNISVGTKFLLLFQPTPTYVFLCAETNRWSLSHHTMQSAERAAPLVPPPRSA